MLIHSELESVSANCRMLMLEPDRSRYSRIKTSRTNPVTATTCLIDSYRLGSSMYNLYAKVLSKFNPAVAVQRPGYGGPNRRHPACGSKECHPVLPRPRTWTEAVRSSH